MSDGEDRPYGRSRWSAGWLDAFAALPGAAAMDLIRGRTDAREGRVTQLHIEPGIVSARVQDHEREQPYPVVLTVPVLPDAVWNRVIDALHAQAGNLAALLDGEPPPGSEFTNALSPHPGELRPVCTCPKRDRQPCRHTAAACNETAAVIETDPFTLLLLRGRSKEQLLDALREHRSTTAPTFPPDGRLATAAYRTAYGPLPPLPRLQPDMGTSEPSAPPIPDPPAVSGLTAAELTALARRAAHAARRLLSEE